MSHESFLAEIIANPDDDTPRLIYADWLEEQGDSRSEFIRIQCEQAALPHYDPRQYELKERENEFKESHLKEWSHRIEKYCQRVEFKRGFVDKVTLRLGEATDRIPRIQQLTPLRAVKFTQTSKGRMTDLAMSEVLLGLKELDFSGEQLGLKVIRELVQSPFLSNIERLDVSDCSINHSGMKELCRARSFTSLGALQIQENSIDGRGLMHLLESDFVSRLEELRLVNISVLPTEIGEFFRQADLSNLKTLELYINSDLSEYSVPNAPQLEHLDLSGDDDTINFVLKLSELNCTVNLRSLLIFRQLANDNNWNWVGMEKLKELEFPSLESFQVYPLPSIYRANWLYETPWFKKLRNYEFGLAVDNSEAKMLASSPIISTKNTLRFSAEIEFQVLKKLLYSDNASHLREIDLSLRKMGARHFLELIDSQLKFAKTLNLFNCPIGDLGLERLSVSSHFTNLTSLNIGRIGATNPGWMEFFQETNDLRLRRLDVSFNYFDSDVIDAFLQWSGIETLESLTLYPNIISNEDMQRLEDTFGERLILHA